MTNFATNPVLCEAAEHDVNSIHNLSLVRIAVPTSYRDKVQLWKIIENT